MNPEHEIPKFLLQSKTDIKFFTRKQKAFNHLIRTFHKDLLLELSEEDLLQKGSIDRRRIKTTKNFNRSDAAKRRKREGDGKFKQGRKKELFGVVKNQGDQAEFQIGDEML